MSIVTNNTAGSATTVARGFRIWAGAGAESAPEPGVYELLHHAKREAKLLFQDVKGTYFICTAGYQWLGKVDQRGYSGWSDAGWACNEHDDCIESPAVGRACSKSQEVGAFEVARMGASATESE